MESPCWRQETVLFQTSGQESGRGQGVWRTQVFPFLGQGQLVKVVSGS